MFTSIIRSHSSTLSAANGAIGMIPALFTITSIRPYLSIAPLTRASTSLRFVTSVLKPMALPPFAVMSLTRASIRSFLLAPSATFAPLAARRRAVLSPRPLLAPVITTTFPSMFTAIIPPFAHNRRLLCNEALVGFQGRGCADVVQPNCCHPFLLEALLLQWPSLRRWASRTLVEQRTHGIQEERRACGLPLDQRLRSLCMVHATARTGLSQCGL